MVIAWVLTLAVPVATTAVLAAFMTFIPFDTLLELVKQHFAAIVGLPVAAVFAVFLVVVLQQASGPIKFKGLGFEFEGTSGQVVLWIACFLAMAAAINMTWSLH